MKLDFEKQNGLIPVIAQDSETQEVLMLAYVNEEAFEKTLETGKAHYYSRSRDKLWMKGESSGHTQEIKEILVDCDEDTLVFKIHQVGGAACHVGYNTCFYRRLEGDKTMTLTKTEKVFDPEKVYSI
ncbi:MAG: phosphoribosyl-AMP cyclohydrolase [SAR324 cluster bacterium]|nr:phosphoribosyl-AMP cyclohydrolase [SAR324 cluster bacterium]